MTKAEQIAINIVQAEADRFRLMLSKATVTNKHTEHWKRLAADLDRIANDLRTQFSAAA